ncbi:hypothetical protein NQZ68_010265, partial [Dissostichus eleginoides]
RWCVAAKVASFDGLCELIVLGQFKDVIPQLVATYRSVQGVIGDVEKTVAIPAVVQSFHQAPPVDLQVRGDPRAPEWANPLGVGSGMVPDKKPVCADPDVGSGFEPFITEAVTETGDFVLMSGMEMGLIPVPRHTIVLDCELVRGVVSIGGDWVRSQKDDSSLSALWTELLPEEKVRDIAQGYFVQEGLPGLMLVSREVVKECTGFSPGDLVFGHTVGKSIETFLKDTGPAQPFLLCIGERNDSIQHFYIVMDQKAIPCKT